MANLHKKQVFDNKSFRPRNTAGENASPSDGGCAAALAPDEQEPLPAPAAFQRRGREDGIEFLLGLVCLVCGK